MVGGEEMIIYLPLEHLDMRYTTHLDESITSYLDSSSKEYIKIYPKVRQQEIIHGSFLDAPMTVEFKSKQIAEVAKLYATEVIGNGDIIFTSDIWFPGLESIAYLNYFCKRDIKIRGILHAGSFTDTDFVRDLERWSKGFEDIIFDVVDRIYVGSNFIKEDVIKKRFVNPDKIKVTGFPLDYRNLTTYCNEFEKENIVVFNGRNVDEKQPWLFEKLKNEVLRDPEFSSVRFVNTQKLKLSKDNYYELLAKAKVIVSFALQENFGFGILEAVYLGCIPVVPDRLVYPEHFNQQYLYVTFDNCVSKVKMALKGKLSSPSLIDYSTCMEEWFK